MSEIAHIERTKKSRSKKVPAQPISSIGSRLRETRLKMGLIQSQIAEACEVTRAAVSQWEEDHTRASIEHLEKAAERLGVDFTWLCLGKKK